MGSQSRPVRPQIHRFLRSCTEAHSSLALPKSDDSVILGYWDAERICICMAMFDPLFSIFLPPYVPMSSSKHVIQPHRSALPFRSLSLLLQYIGF